MEAASAPAPPASLAVGVALEYEATLSKEHVSVDLLPLQSPLPEKPEVRLGDITPCEAAALPPGATSTEGLKKTVL